MFIYKTMLGILLTLQKITKELVKALLRVFLIQQLWE